MFLLLFILNSSTVAESATFLLHLQVEHKLPTGYYWSHSNPMILLLTIAGSLIINTVIELSLI